MEAEIGALKNEIKTMTNAKGGFQSYARRMVLSVGEKVGFKHQFEN